MINFKKKLWIRIKIQIQIQGLPKCGSNADPNQNLGSGCLSTAQPYLESRREALALARLFATFQKNESHELYEQKKAVRRQEIEKNQCINTIGKAGFLYQVALGLL